jgi:catechol 2,3-dioxygenase-like lactoylglutathione lyase family enzyme
MTIPEGGAHRPRPRLVPELVVDDIGASLAFWVDLLGWRIVYQRPEDGFAFLDRDGAELMLDQRGGGVADRIGIWDTGPMQRPYGRGINLEVVVDDYDHVFERVSTRGVPIFFGPEERWYRADDIEIGVRQFLLQDPDGYLVRLQQTIGERPAKRAQAQGSPPAL